MINVMLLRCFRSMHLTLWALFIFLFLISGTLTTNAQSSLLDVPGKIAYIGNDFNVYSLELNTANPIQLTFDAGTSRRYQWPTWSYDDRLAFFCCDPFFAEEIVTEVYTSAGGVAEPEITYESSDGVFNYASWSPRSCFDEADCRELAVLLSSVRSQQLSVEIVRSSSGTDVTSQTIGLGAPFYYSWSPDGSRLLLHRDNGVLDIYEPRTHVFDRLPQIPGYFQAPGWSPVDDRLLFGVRKGPDSTDLIIYANAEEETLVPDLRGQISFSWSPDGNYVAYRTFFENRLSRLYIVDAITGQMVTETIDDSAIAFFWAPDSSALAYVTLATPRGAFTVSDQWEFPVRVPDQRIEGLAWSVIDLRENETRRYNTFLPTSEMIYIFNFFDQFSQSHRIWSPDSTHIVYSEVSMDGNHSISILDTTQPDTVPFFIAEGVIGIWSYH